MSLSIAESCKPAFRISLTVVIGQQTEMSAADRESSLYLIKRQLLLCGASQPFAEKSGDRYRSHNWPFISLAIKGLLSANSTRAESKPECPRSVDASYQLVQLPNNSWECNLSPSRRKVGGGACFALLLQPKHIGGRARPNHQSRKQITLKVGTY